MTNKQPGLARLHFHLLSLLPKGKQVSTPNTEYRRKQDWGQGRIL